MMGYGDIDMQVAFKFDHMIAFWKKMNSIGLKAREYSSCTYVDGSLVVFGGLSYAKMNEISILRFKFFSIFYGEG